MNLPDIIIEVPIALLEMGLIFGSPFLFPILAASAYKKPTALKVIGAVITGVACVYDIYGASHWGLMPPM